MERITSRWPHQDSIKVEWNIGKRCNYDCSYCPNEIHDLTSPHADVSILKTAIDKLSLLGKPIRLSFTGGEPCINPKIAELIDYARYKSIYWINVTTNGTRKSDWYIKQNVDHYVFSLHFEFGWQRVLQTIIDVHKRSNKVVMVNLMVHPDKIEEAKLSASKLKLSDIKYVLRRIRWTQGDHDLFDDMRYHPDDLKWILSLNSTVDGNCVIDNDTIIHANDVIKHKLNCFTDWNCNAGLESLMINWDGEVHRATCRVGGSLGNIYNGTFELPTSAVVCTRNWCTCAADIPLTKYKLNQNQSS